MSAGVAFQAGRDILHGRWCSEKDDGGKEAPVVRDKCVDANSEGGTPPPFLPSAAVARSTDLAQTDWRRWRSKCLTGLQLSRKGQRQPQAVQAARSTALAVYREAVLDRSVSGHGTMKVIGCGSLNWSEVGNLALHTRTDTAANCVDPYGLL